MRQPSTPLPWLASLAVAMLAVFVLQTGPDPGRYGPFVGLGRLLARASLVGVVGALLWRAASVLRAADERHLRRLGLGVGGGVVVAVVFGFLGYGNALATVGPVALGVGGMLVLTADRRHGESE